MTPNKKLWWALGAIILITILILAKQISEALKITITPSTMPPIATNSTNLPTTTTDPILGNPGADTTLVSFFDLTDSKSMADYKIIASIVNSSPKKVRLIWKDWPGTGWITDPVLAHQAAYCAGKQDQRKFWSYIDALAASDKRLSETNLEATARQIFLNMPLWKLCLKDPQTVVAVAGNAALGRGLGLPAAPVLFVNNKFLNLAAGADLKQLITTFITP